MNAAPVDWALTGAVFAGTALVTAALVGVVRRYSIRAAIVDVPNDRSSHDCVTPRGGGLAIALVLLGAVIALGGAGLVAARTAMAFAGGMVLVAIVGWLDDRGHVSARWRAAAQLAAAGWALGWLGGLPAIDLGPARLELGLAGSVLAAIAMVWLINLYNFMDGTDALAGIEGLTVAGFAGLWLLPAGAAGLGLLCLVIAGACAGFLWWNRPPARIFLGDVGSYTLGFTFALLAVVTEREGLMPALVWLILLAVFVWDATFTLLRRLLHRERWYSAHRSHAYQRLARRLAGHGRVAVIVAVLNVGLLWPAAWIALEHRRATALMAAGTALVMFALWYAVHRADVREARSAPES